MADIMSKENNKDIYPLTIIRDRYNGVYSKGKYLAFNLDYYDIPQEIDGYDVECFDFWCYSEPSKYKIGKGNTIEEALENLIELLAKEPTDDR